MKRKRPSGKRVGNSKKRPYKRRRFMKPIPGGAQLNVDARPNSVLNPRGKSAIPQSMNVKLKYSYANDFATGVAQIQNFRLNSLYDPDRTNIGGQPMGYDQWSAFYQRYRVNAARVKVTILNGFDSTSTTQPLFVALYPNYEISGSAKGVTEVMEQPTVSYDFVQNSDGGGSDSVKSLTFYTKLNNYFGVTPRAYQAEQLYSAETNADPTNQAVLALQTGGLIGLNTTSYYYVVDITYYATFYEPKTLQQS